MIDRSSQEAQFNTAQSPSAQQSSMGAFRADAAKFSKTQELSDGRSGETASDRLLSSILGAGGKLAEQFYEKSKEEAYLSGVAKAGTLESEDDLQGNPITKDWQTAGYRDTMGRLAAADNESRIASDMHKMREKPPEEFGEYLAERRSEFLPQLEGMSLRARQTMFSQTMLSERANIKLHGAEHYKFVVDTLHKGKEKAYGGFLAGMKVAKADSDVDGGAAYAAKTAATFGFQHSQVVDDERLPLGNKPKLIMDMAQNALAEDHQMLYNQMNETVITLPGGESGTMLSMLSIDDRVKLSKEYRESLSRSQTKANAAFGQRTGMLMADLGNDLSPMIPQDEFAKHVEEGVNNGYFKEHEVEGMWKKWADAGVAKGGASKLAGFAATGDTNGPYALGKTKTDAVNAHVTQLFKAGGDFGSVLSVMLTRGSGAAGVTGYQAEYNEKAGEMLNNVLPSFRAGADGMVDRNSAAALSAVYKALDYAKKNGNAASYSQMLQKLTPENAAKFAYLRSATVVNGSSPEDALLFANTEMDRAANLKPEQIAESRRKVSSENQKFSESISDSGVINSSMGWARQFLPNFVGGSDGKEQSISITKLPWDEQREVSAMMRPVKMAILGDLNEIRDANPGMSIDDAGAIATAQVANRTVHTKGGILVLENGVKPQDFFGLKAGNVDLTRIAKAIDERTPHAVEHDNVAYQAQSNGSIGYVLYNDGVIVDHGTYSGKIVGPLMEQMETESADKYGREQGRGTKVGAGDVEVSYNGLNYVGVDESMMYEFRAGLIKHEGVKSKAYNDIGGSINKKTGKVVQTVGVGVSDTNTFYPKPDANGNITKQQINESFTKASNEAAGFAQKLMVKTRVMGKPAFRLFAELSYQAGPKVLIGESYAPLREAMASGNYPAAKAALESSPAWRWTAEGSARRNLYRDSLKQAMKG